MSGISCETKVPGEQEKKDKEKERKKKEKEYLPPILSAATRERSRRFKRNTRESGRWRASERIV